MGLIGGRSLIVVILLFIGTGWAIGNGFIRWEKDPYKCLYKRGFQSVVPQQRLITLGNLHIYYQPLNYGCPEDQRYDPTKYKAENGLIMPN